MSVYTYNFKAVLFILVPLSILSFSPFIAGLMAVCYLFLVKNDSDYREWIKSQYLIIILMASTFFFTLSVENFQVRSDDFTSYYNYFLDIHYKYVSLSELIKYSFPEIGLPLVNYISEIVINNIEPYKLKSIYLIIHLTGLYIIINLVSIRLKFNNGQLAIFSCLTIVFFNSIIGIQVSKQTISSIFILIGIFSERKPFRTISILCAVVFHLSALLIYPLSMFLLKKRSRKDIIYVLFTVVIVNVLLLFIIPRISSFLIGIPVLDKLDFTIRMMSDPERVLQSLRTSLMLLIYLSPLVIYSFLFRQYPQISYVNNVMILIILVLGFCYFPGINNRVFLIQFYIFLGFYYALVFLKEGNLNKLNEFSARLLLLFVAVIMLINTHFLKAGAYSRFDIVGETPFYYMSTLDEEVGRINRSILD